MRKRPKVTNDCMSGYTRKRERTLVLIRRKLPQFSEVKGVKNQERR